MDTVTYPHAEVRQELDRHWIDARVDVTDGVVLGRVEGFAEPAMLRRHLEEFRSKR